MPPMTAWESPAGGGINSLGVSRCPMGTVIIAYGDEDTKRHAIAKGAIGLLTKPLDFTLLREEIDTRLGPANWPRVALLHDFRYWHL
jgi:hypothetical protein